MKKTEPLWPVFDSAKPDYLESLVPFRRHPVYESANDEMKRLALSCGWIAYNEKTIAIESKVVNESVHNALFKSLGAAIFGSLNRRERGFFTRVLPLPIEWFSSAELEVWRAMLRQIDFPDADGMIDDCLCERRSLAAGLDLTTLDDLYADLGIEREPVV